MLTTLAFKSVAHDWRRYAPAAFAVGFSGLMVLLQAAIILGIFSMASVYVSRSQGDIWVGYPGVQSLDLGRPIAAGVAPILLSNPDVRRVEPLQWGSGEWRTAHKGVVNVYIVGIDPDPRAMALAGALDGDLRAALWTPDTVVVDAADLAKLDSAVGRTAIINGRRVRIGGVTRGMRGLGGVNVITSLETARRLDPAASPGGTVAYLLASLADPSDLEADVKALNAQGLRRGFEVMTAKGFARRTTRYWLVESGAGVAFVFGSVVAVLVAVVITSQTLLAAVTASMKEYAALHALGFSLSDLQRIVLMQSLLVGGCGLVVAAALTIALAGFGRAFAVPLVLSVSMTAFASVVILGVALGSGAMALRRLSRADPAELLL